MQRGLVGSEMCIRDRRRVHGLFKMLGWWKEPAKEEKKLKTWICDFCKKEFDEDHSQFSKFDHIYCSMNCLRGHLKAQSKQRYCLLYTSDAADDTPCVDLGGRRIIKKKNTKKHEEK
eukprot:TRINITY_DN56282_c0_g1_i1.p2 TRINITY_DN56282_c0_g1~~TRINITY_DN56282_c0_g1_i1.p2  ORF type:complete len:117 (-),score=40.81 TRINITY_DN56282_c0_g1_i1:35-385(-)